LLKGFADTVKPFFIITNYWTHSLLTKGIIAAPLFIISVPVDKTQNRYDKIFIRNYIIQIRFDIITDCVCIINIRIDIITDLIYTFLIRFDKYLLCTDKDSLRSKSGTYARHTKANTQNQTLHNSQSCPTLLGHTLIIGSSFLVDKTRATYNMRFYASVAGRIVHQHHFVIVHLFQLDE
jgi:hypothetical protein